MTTWSDKLKRNYAECDQWRDIAIKEIIAMKPQLVIISQLSISHLTEEIDDPSEYSSRKKEWADGISSTVRALSDAGIKVVFLRDVPTHKSYLDKCVARALWQGRDPSICDTPRGAALNEGDAKIEEGIVSENQECIIRRYEQFFLQRHAVPCHDRWKVDVPGSSSHCHLLRRIPGWAT